MIYPQLVYMFFEAVHVLCIDYVSEKLVPCACHSMIERVLQNAEVFSLRELKIMLSRGPVRLLLNKGGWRASLSYDLKCVNILMMSSCNRLNARDAILSFFRFSAYSKSCITSTNLVGNYGTFSRRLICFSKYGDQTHCAYSRCR